MLKTGVYVDAANINQNGGWGMRYDILKKVATRGTAHLLRANAYVVRDKDREKNNSEWRTKVGRYFDKLRSFGFKLFEKVVATYTDEDGNVSRKANADMEIAVDALLQVKNLDRIVLLSGDGDFVRLVQALQNMGCRVEVIAFKNYSNKLRTEVDFFINGYLVPDLVPFDEKNEWGVEGNLVRGVISNWVNNKGYGFVNFLQTIDENLTHMEHWQTAILHKKALEGFEHIDPDSLSGRIVEFRLNSRKDNRLAADNAILIKT